MKRDRGPGLIGLLKRYDDERETYIECLEEQLAAAQKLNGELGNLLASSVASNERKQLDLIMSGHYDKFRKQTEERKEIDELTKP